MLTLLTLTAAATSTPLAPITKWNVEYAKDMCVLSRTYAVEGGRVTLGLRPYPMGTETEVVLVTPGEDRQVVSGKAELSLLPAATIVSGTYGRWKLPNTPGRLATLALGPDALNGVETSEALTIRLAGKETYTFALPAIGVAMHALSTCQDDLLRTWGIDPAERLTVVTPPKGNPAQFFTSSSYPAEALRAGQDGKTAAVAIISPLGRVDTCIVASSSGSQALDNGTCAILRTRARFSPGRDKDGKPVTSHMIVPVRWVLP